MITDGTHRHFVNGESVSLMAKVGTFAEHTCVSETSVIKVAEDLAFDCVALVSCGVATGFGSATKRADVQVGDSVVVVGIGGIGINAVQGAKLAGAKVLIAVDPIEFKRDTALQFGATHVFASMADALPEVARLTNGEMADKVILSPGVVYGDLMALGTALAGKGGTIVVTGVAPMTQTESSVNLFELAMWNKEIKGTLFGSLTPRVDVPRLLDLYRAGQLKLDELITNRYSLDEINEGYQAMRDGTNIRGVIVFD
jgi:S-(hydroxymethyl)glutathione dehydrogenase/alcohol dehydrogenase